MKLATLLGARRRAKPTANLLRHQRKCRICNHEQREAIESRFLLWESAHSIVEDFGLGHRCLLYRHAKATGLLDQRRENFASVLDSIVERCESAPVTGATILRAMRAYSCLNAHGRWVDPPKHVIFEHRSQSPATPKSNPDSAEGSPATDHSSAAIEFLIETEGLENAANP